MTRQMWTCQRCGRPSTTASVFLPFRDFKDVEQDPDPKCYHCEGKRISFPACSRCEKYIERALLKIFSKVKK